MLRWRQRWDDLFCKECKIQAPSYGSGGRSPKELGEVVHTDLKCQFKAAANGTKYFQVFVRRVGTRELLASRPETRKLLHTISSKSRENVSRFNAYVAMEVENSGGRWVSYACWQTRHQLAELTTSSNSRQWHCCMGDTVAHDNC